MAWCWRVVYYQGLLLFVAVGGGGWLCSGGLIRRLLGLVCGLLCVVFGFCLFGVACLGGGEQGKAALFLFWAACVVCGLWCAVYYYGWLLFVPVGGCLLCAGGRGLVLGVVFCVPVGGGLLCSGGRGLVLGVVFCVWFVFVVGGL